MRQRLMGFFKYDLFPYCTAHEITRIEDDGDLYSSGIGTFSANSLLLLVPYDAGKDIENNLDTLRRQHRQEQLATDKIFSKKVSTLLGVKI